MLRYSFRWVIMKENERRGISWNKSCKDVLQFVETTAEKVEALIGEGKEVVLFVGRPTCPLPSLCSKINEVREALGEKKCFINSEDRTKLSSFPRNTIAPTVPGLLAFRRRSAWWFVTHHKVWNKS